MRHKKIFTLLLSISVLPAIASCATNHGQASGFKASGDEFKYSTQGREVTIRMKPEMTQWAVNCSKSRALVWGGAWDDLNPGDQPYSRVFLLNLTTKKIVTEISVTRGPYEVIFNKEPKLVVVDDIFIDQNSGALIDTRSLATLEAESCDDFPGKNSNAPNLEP